MPITSSTVITPHQPAISVIMAVYNTQCYLENAIASILSQDFHSFELIIVDDGSSDDSPLIIKKFLGLDSRIKLITQKNAGIGAATQRAITASRGQYIAIMDSDDISLPQRLSLQKDFLDQHSDIDAVGSQWQMITPDGKKAGIDTHPTSPETIQLLMYSYFSLHHPTTMIRRSAIEKVGGYNTARSCIVPDYDLFMRLQLSGSRFANLPFVLFQWRLNPDSTTRSKAAVQAASVFSIRDDGFSSYLRANPANAKRTARSIIYNFPTGSWQDHRMTLLLPKQRESLLFNTWHSQPADTLQEQLYRTMVLWLEEPMEHYQSLSELLSAQGMLEFSVLLDHKFTQSDRQISPVLLPPVKESPSTTFKLSLFIPFFNDLEDFSQRLQLASDVEAKADFTVELIIFSADKHVFNDAVLSSCRLKTSTITVYTSPYSWKQAIESAGGHYFCYLEQNFRFNIPAFMLLVQLARTSLPDQLYLFDEHYYSEAMDADGKPLRDDLPNIKWSRETLLGRDRLSLSGFIHKRSLLKEYPALLHECGSIASHVLARQLVLHDFEIHFQALDYFIPAINLKASPLGYFYKNMVNWFFDYGNGQLPDPSCWQRLNKTQLKQIALSLSLSWANKKLILHPGNRSIIKQFYLKHVKNPMCYPLFRHLLIHNKREILSALWCQGAYVNSAIATLHCVYSMFRRRLSS